MMSDDLDVNTQKFPNIPGLENLPINTSALPDPAEVEKLFKKKCEQNGGEDAYRIAKVLFLPHWELV